MFFLSSLIESHSQKIALVRREGKTVSLELIKSLDPHVNPLYMLQRVLYKKKVYLVSGLASQDVLVRSISSKLKSRKGILATLPFQIEGLIPLPKEELIVLPLLYPPQKKKGETDLLLLVTTSLALTSHLKGLSFRHIKPDIVSCLPLALLAFAQYLHPKHSSIFVYHTTDTHAFFILVKEGHLTSAQTLFSQEFDRVLAYMNKKHPEITQILLTGIGPSPSLPPHMHSLPLPDPIWKEYALPIGLALEGALHPTRQFHPQVSRKKRGALTIYLLASLFLTVSIFGIGCHHIHQKEKIILEKLHLKGPLSTAAKKLKEELVEQSPSVLPISQVPTLTEFLNWVSTYPPFQEECFVTHLHYQLVESAPKSSKGASSSPTTLQSEEKKRMQAKVELTLVTETTRKGQALHQALLKETRMVGSKTTFTWEQNQLTCKACFFLAPQEKNDS